MKPLDNPRTNASSRDELLNAGIAHTHQGEFCRREEGIGRHQEKDQKDPEQHKSDHGKVILTNAAKRRQWPAQIQLFLGTPPL